MTSCFFSKDTTTLNTSCSKEAKLEQLSFGAKLRIDSSVWSIDELGNSDNIVDSGTLTFVPGAAYVKILVVIKRRVKLPSPRGATPGFDLCFNVKSEPRSKLSRLSLELNGGSMLKLPLRNYFIDTEEGIKCLAVQPVGKEMGFLVMQNIMQQGLLFEFDRDKSLLTKKKKKK
ncbi:Detected protein of confused Function [Hibiscus syriacus]|uniref:Detected protein of confused Function n=1 Tax=Hibiscus syriacus TaxID=106335 RepID=A0A6A2XKA3_HIBSY|nr:Detected protein of confused Function [Hibiscus syriacus]